MNIDLQETQEITKKLADFLTKSIQLQNDLQKPIQRIRHVSKAKDQFGDDITPEVRGILFTKAKAEFELIQEKYGELLEKIEITQPTMVERRQ